MNPVLCVWAQEEVSKRQELVNAVKREVVDLEEHLLEIGYEEQQLAKEAELLDQVAPLVGEQEDAITKGDGFLTACRGLLQQLGAEGEAGRADLEATLLDEEARAALIERLRGGGAGGGEARTRERQSFLSLSDSAQ